MTIPPKMATLPSFFIEKKDPKIYSIMVQNLKEVSQKAKGNTNECLEIWAKWSFYVTIGQVVLNSIENAQNLIQKPPSYHRFTMLTKNSFLKYPSSYDKAQ